MWDSADLAVLMDTDLPGAVTVTLSGGGTVSGLFRDSFNGVFGGMAEGSTPQFLCVDSVFPVLGEAVTIRGVSYTVTAREPDKTTGMLRVMLK